MELLDYLKIIKKHLAIFIIIVVLATTLAFVLTKTGPTTYTAATTFTASKSSKINPVETYDPITKICSGLQLSNSYSEIVSAWFVSPTIVKEFYQEAGIALPKVTQNKLAKTFRAIYTPEGVISVTILGQNPNDLTQLLDAANRVLQRKTVELSDRQANNYQLTEETPIVTADQTNLWLNTVIGFITGLILATLSVMSIEYFTKKRK